MAQVSAGQKKLIEKSYLNCWVILRTNSMLDNYIFDLVFDIPGKTYCKA